jgi:hypothetical protein
MKICGFADSRPQPVGVSGDVSTTRSTYEGVRRWSLRGD